MLNRVGASIRYAKALRQVLRDPVTAREGRERIDQALHSRAETFLDTVERAVYANSRSPFRALLLRSNISLADVQSLVSERGIEGTLRFLYDSGVYVTADEFKGRSSIRRPGFELSVTPEDFDNPLADRFIRGHTSGSSGRPVEVFTGFDLVTYESSHYASLFEAAGLSDRPLGCWHSALHTALKTTFRHMKTGRRPEKWFTPTPFRWNAHAFKEEYVLAITLILARLMGQALPRSEYVPRGEVQQVAAWLAEKTAMGTPAVLETNHSLAVRVCLAAREQNLDIRGTYFHLTGEPYTEAKHQVLAQAGATALNRYANVEIGIMGVACTKPRSFDDTHFMSDKLALIVQPKTLPAGDPVQSLVITTVMSKMPKLMLNVESGDYGQITEYNCGCPLGSLGMSTHLSGIRSHDKLTSEGVTFSATALFNLIEKELPGEFGGGPTDYQIVEEEVGSLPRVGLIVRPSLGPINEPALIEFVMHRLKQYSDTSAIEWRQGGTLVIIRRDPYETSSAKILPLHVVR